MLIYTLLLGSCISYTPPWTAESAKAASDAKKPIVLSMSTHLPNSVGGVDVGFAYRSVSNKPIKYLRLSFRPRNAVNDIVASRIGDRTIVTGEVTGPIEPGAEVYGRVFENAWYNGTIKCVELVEVQVEFMDGSAFSEKSPEGLKLIRPDFGGRACPGFP